MKKIKCKFKLILPLIIIGYVSALSNGFLPALQSYSCAPYGSLTYHLAVTLSGVSGAISAIITTHYVNCHQKRQMINKIQIYTQKLMLDNSEINPNMVDSLLTSFLNSSNLQIYWSGLAFLCLIPSSYVIYLASSSPNPPFMNGFGFLLAVRNS